MKGVPPPSNSNLDDILIRESKKGFEIIVPNLPKSKKFPFQYKMHIRWIDTDAAGIAHFSNFLRFVEEAEEMLLSKLGFDYSGLASNDSLRLPRVEVFCKYLSPCRHNDQIRVSIRITDVTSRTFREEFEIFNTSSGKLSADGYFVCVGTNLDVSKSMAFPKSLTSKLEGMKV